MSVARNGDPTKTTTLRERKFRPALTRRVDALIGVTRTTIAENDALQLRAAREADSTTALAADDITPKSAPFYDNEGTVPSAERRRSAFIEWLRRQASKGILEPVSDRQVKNGEHYTAKYVRLAANKGEQSAVSALENAGISVSLSESGAGVGALSRPVRTELLAELYEQPYENLKGLNSDMADEVREALTDGALRGENPRRVASTINDRIRKVGRHRAELIARTETIRAHNQTALKTYERFLGQSGRMGYTVEGVSAGKPSGLATKQEHITAGDSRVCSQCAALAGTTYSVGYLAENKAQAMPPLNTHPQCRCSLAPIV